MAAFAKMFKQRDLAGGTEPIDLMARELSALVANLGRQFERDELNAEITKLSLFVEDDFADLQAVINAEVNESVE